MTLIKWPGGKTGEIKEFKDLIPKFERYIEPFFGGGAVFFYLKPEKAVINDISENLMDFYRLIQKQDKEFKDIILAYNDSFNYFYQLALENQAIILEKYDQGLDFQWDEMSRLFPIRKEDFIIVEEERFYKRLTASINDKLRRTRNNDKKHAFSDDDLIDNLLTGITSGFYLYFRDIYNDIQLDRAEVKYSHAYKIANFFWIREYCYGSMFRYNRQGEFNIPYGGISYNTKQFINKINKIFTEEIMELFDKVDIHNEDFESLLNKIELTKQDFMFLDPPYDTNFSSYEDRPFEQADQKRLRDFLKNTQANFILVIKNTDFIMDLYDSPDFKILTFDTQYLYNVRDRNDRQVKHLIISNPDLPMSNENLLLF